MEQAMQSAYVAHGFWHYVGYQQCPRRGYISNILKLAPVFTPPALCKGSMVHAGVAGFRQGGTAHGMQEFQAAAVRVESEFESGEKYVEVVNSVEQMLKDYFRTYAGDANRYEFIAVEQELHPIAHGANGAQYELFLKTDAVARDKERSRFVVFETKHSSSMTPERQYAKLFNQDQATAYLWAWNQLHPEQHANTCIPDMLYHNKSVLYCRRPGEIYRSDHDLMEYELGIVEQIHGIQERLKRLARGENPIVVFPRRGDCDGDGFYTCDYRSICRAHLEPGDPPLGFKPKERRE
jgi:hypothetical protein